MEQSTNISEYLSFQNQEEEVFDWDEPRSKQQRRTVYYILHGLVGLFTVLCNGFLLLIYAKKRKVRKHVSLLMLNVFISCFIHGWIVGIIYPLQRVYRYTLDDTLCVIFNLVMDFSARYPLMLLPMLAIERLLFLKFPFMKIRTKKVYACSATIGLVFFTMLYTWLPMIPQLDVPKSKEITSSSIKKQQQIDNFYRAYSCNEKINKKNHLEPVFTLIVSSLCVIIVIVTYLWMFFIAKARLEAFPSLTQRRKYKLKRAAVSVMLVSVIFIFTMMPYGIVLPARGICEADVTLRKNSFCNGLTLELRFVFSIISHLGNVLAPFLFAVLSPYIRNGIQQYLSCKVNVNELCTKLKESREAPATVPSATSKSPDNSTIQALISLKKVRSRAKDMDFLPKDSISSDHLYL